MQPELLLTGATGFVGGYLARALAARGTYFSALVRSGSDTSQLEALGEWCTLREGDLRDPESLVDALSGITGVVHAAASVHLRSGSEAELLAVNGGGTANLVNMMLECGVRRLVHLSSVAVLDRTDGGREVTIEDRWPQGTPNTAYARSKFAAEREIWRGWAEGLSVAAVYPSVILGAGNWEGENTPALWRRASFGSWVYPRGRGGFVDVRDVVQAILALLDRDLDRDRLLVNAANLSWREVLVGIAGSIDADPPTTGLARWQGALLWPLADAYARLRGGKRLITRDTHRMVQAEFTYDGSAYQGVTGNTYIPISKTLEETGRAFQLSRSLGTGLPPTYLPLLGTHTADRK